MEAQEFVTPYNREVPPPSMDEPYATDPALVISREWEKLFGQFLFDHLSEPGSVNQKEFSEAQIDYKRWLYGSFSALNNRFLYDRSQEGLTISQELNYHRLNAGINPMWEELFIDLRLTPTGRSKMIQAEQDMLAINGVRFYEQRELEAGQTKKFAYISRDNTYVRERHNGMLTELDVAIVLLNRARQRPGRIVIPAPTQFESKSGPHNADFILFEPDEKQANAKVVGIQVKSFVDEEKLNHYDKKRIILVDGDRDLDNMLRRRIDPTNSRTLVMTWAGMISATRAARIQLQGRNMSEVVHAMPKSELLNLRHTAIQATTTTELVATKKGIRDKKIQIRSTEGTATKRIDERISAYLAASALAA